MHQREQLKTKHAPTLLFMVALDAERFFLNTVILNCVLSVTRIPTNVRILDTTRRME